MDDDPFRDAVMQAAHTALVDDDASEEERQAVADDLNDAWPPEVPEIPTVVLFGQMHPELRDAFSRQGIPDDQVLSAAYALAHFVRFGEPFRPA
jgi:hypothetical protein